nr:hypothetical protein CFP56_70207 [Quercus suber]
MLSRLSLAHSLFAQTSRPECYRCAGYEQDRLDCHALPLRRVFVPDRRARARPKITTAYGVRALEGTEADVAGATFCTILVALCIATWTSVVEASCPKVPLVSASTLLCKRSLSVLVELCNPGLETPLTCEEFGNIDTFQPLSDCACFVYGRQVFGPFGLFHTVAAQHGFGSVVDGRLTSMLGTVTAIAHEHRSSISTRLSDSPFRSGRRGKCKHGLTRMSSTSWRPAGWTQGSPLNEIGYPRPLVAD